MARTFVGTRIRERRRHIGINQSELARQIGISPSYLNLIERNKRRIAGALLQKIAAALSVSVEELDGAAEHRLAETLEEVAHLPSLAGIAIEAQSAGELIGRYPGWARVIAALARSERDATATARALSDRLTHDPFLGETVHRMLSRISAIRSASEIITEFPDVSPKERSRFDAIINEESRTLSEVSEVLAAYFDRWDDTQSTLTPIDEVEAFFESHGNHFSEIEMAAEPYATQIADVAEGDRSAQAKDLAVAELAGLIAALVEKEPQIQTSAGKARAGRALLDYAIGAILAPLSMFEPVATEVGYDAELLSEKMGVRFDLVCRRLTALKPVKGALRFGYMRANAAGTIIEMLGLPGLVVPRYAAACPLWALYRAQQNPEVAMRQLAQFPSGLRFVFVARARASSEVGYGRSRHYVTDMLAMSDADSQATVYAWGSNGNVEEVGAACRICSRRDCPQRVDDPLAG